MKLVAEMKLDVKFIYAFWIDTARTVFIGWYLIESAIMQLFAFAFKVSIVQKLIIYYRSSGNSSSLR